MRIEAKSTNARDSFSLSLLSFLLYDEGYRYSESKIARRKVGRSSFSVIPKCPRGSLGFWATSFPYFLLFFSLRLLDTCTTQYVPRHGSVGTVRYLRHWFESANRERRGSLDTFALLSWLYSMKLFPSRFYYLIFSPFLLHLLFLKSTFDKFSFCHRSRGRQGEMMGLPWENSKEEEDVEWRKNEGGAEHAIVVDQERYMWKRES